MKNMIAIVAIMMMGVAAVPQKAEAKINIQININTQPIWGPVGYDYAQFYYFPDHNFYYDVNRSQYVIRKNNKWMYTKNVPAGYRFNPYTAYKVVLNESTPFQNNSKHVRFYAQYKGKGNQQQLIRDSRDSRYYGNQEHPMYAKNQTNKNTKRNDRNENRNDDRRNTAAQNSGVNQKNKTTGGAR